MTMTRKEMKAAADRLLGIGRRKRRRRRKSWGLGKWPNLHAKGIRTRPKDPGFVAYQGEAPPWE